MLVVIANAKVLPAATDAFVAAARACIAETRKEAGCLVYDLHRSVSDPQHFTFVERWESQAALDEHMNSAHLKAFLAAAGPCLADAPTIEAIPADIIRRLM